MSQLLTNEERLVLNQGLAELQRLVPGVEWRRPRRRISGGISGGVGSRTYLLLIDVVPDRDGWEVRLDNGPTFSAASVCEVAQILRPRVVEALQAKIVAAEAALAPHWVSLG
jgi:hypothetical protein